MRQLTSITVPLAITCVGLILADSTVLGSTSRAA